MGLAGVAGPEGGHLLAAQAALAAEPLGAVTGGVHEDPVAALRMADPEATLAAGAHHDRQGGGAGGASGLGSTRLLLLTLKVQVPGLPVVASQLGSRVVVVQQPVDPLGDLVLIPGSGGLEDLSEPPRQIEQPLGIRVGESPRATPDRGLSHLSRLPSDGGGPRAHLLPAAAEAGGESIHQFGRGLDAQIHVTIEIHLTS